MNSKAPPSKSVPRPLPPPAPAMRKTPTPPIPERKGSPIAKKPPVPPRMTLKGNSISSPNVLSSTPPSTPSIPSAPINSERASPRTQPPPLSSSPLPMRRSPSPTPSTATNSLSQHIPVKPAPPNAKRSLPSSYGTLPPQRTKPGTVSSPSVPTYQAHHPKSNTNHAHTPQNSSFSSSSAPQPAASISTKGKSPPNESEVSQILCNMGKDCSLSKLMQSTIEYENKSSLYLKMQWLTVAQAQTFAPKKINANTFFTLVDETVDTFPAEVYNQPLKKMIAETSNLTLRKSLEYQLIILPKRYKKYGPTSSAPKQPSIASTRFQSIGRSSATLDTEGSETSSVIDSIVEVEEDSAELVFLKTDDGRSIVKGGTVNKLIERLTSPHASDPDYKTAFLLTYRSFTTPTYLLDALIERFNIKPPPDCTGAALENWKQKMLKPIRLRVCNTVKHWAENHFSDFALEDELLRKLTEFIDQDIGGSPGLQIVSARIHKLIERKLQGGLDTHIIYSNMEHQSSRLSMTGLGARSKRSLLDYDPAEVAKQLTLLEYLNFKAIQPRECLNQAWSKSDKEINAPNIVNMIKRTNAVPCWVATEIVFCDKPKQRSNLVKHFISVAEKCRALNNFNAIMEIISGLQLSAIYRLKRTWEGVPPKSMAALQDLKDLMKVSSNWKAYREALKKCNPPCVPYLGVYLTDLTFLEDGNPDKLEGDLINFIKRRKLSVVIQEIQQYQTMAYNFEVHQGIRDYLNDMQWVDENELWNMSLICEPREATAGAGSSD